MAKYKCKICNKQYVDLSSLLNHIEHKHKEMIPEDMNVNQYYYYMKTGKTHGNCVMCKQPTEWNKNTNKYNRFCNNPSCKEKYREIFKKRMIGKYGKTHLLNDPEKQREMLAHRKISGEYEWSDGTKTTYTGTYDLDFLTLLDDFFEWDPNDISMPSPHNYSYMYEGVEKFYFPDVFIHSLDLEIEIKDGGNNPNTHPKIQAVDKVKEKLKDEVMMSQKSFNYIKIYNKNYINFFNFLKEYKNQFEKYGDSDKIPRIFMIEDKERMSKPPKYLKESYEPVEEVGAFLIDKITAGAGKLAARYDFDALVMMDIESSYDCPEKVQEKILNLLNSCRCDKDFKYIETVIRRTVDYYEKHPTIPGWIEYRQWIRYQYRKDEKAVKRKNETRDCGYDKVIENTIVNDKMKHIDLSYDDIQKYLKNKDDVCLTKLLNDYSSCYERELESRPDTAHHINDDVKKTINYIDGLVEQGLVDREFTEKHKNKLKRLVESNDTILTLIYEKSPNNKVFSLLDDTTKLYIGDKYYIQRPDGIAKVNCLISEGCLSNDVADNNIIQYKLTTNFNFNEEEIMEKMITEGMKVFNLFDLNDKSNNFLHDICKNLNIDGEIKRI